jgi:hypothetical protein
MQTVGFDPANPANESPQTDAVDRRVTGIDVCRICCTRLTARMLVTLTNNVPVMVQGESEIRGVWYKTSIDGLLGSYTVGDNTFVLAFRNNSGTKFYPTCCSVEFAQLAPSPPFFLPPDKVILREVSWNIRGYQFCSTNVLMLALVMSTCGLGELYKWAVTLRCIFCIVG